MTLIFSLSLKNHTLPLKLEPELREKVEEKGSKRKNRSTKRKEEVRLRSVPEVLVVVTAVSVFAPTGNLFNPLLMLRFNHHNVMSGFRDRSPNLLAFDLHHVAFNF